MFPDERPIYAIQALFASFLEHSNQPFFIRVTVDTTKAKNVRQETNILSPIELSHFVPEVSQHSAMEGVYILGKGDLLCAFDRAADQQELHREEKQGM